MKPIEELAGGRVYTGRQALELGLVDKIGTLRDALDHVVAEAQLKDYEVCIVPEPKNALERLLEEAAGEQEEKPSLDAADGRRPLAGRPASLAAMAMPYLRDLDPQRVTLIVRALERLQLMQQEGVILMMPELSIGRSVPPARRTASIYSFLEWASPKAWVRKRGPGSDYAAIRGTPWMKLSLLGSDDHRSGNLEPVAIVYKV